MITGIVILGVMLIEATTFVNVEGNRISFKENSNSKYYKETPPIIADDYLRVKDAERQLIITVKYFFPSYKLGGDFNMNLGSERFYCRLNL